MSSPLSDEEYLRKLEQQTLVDREFIEGAFQYWFDDGQDHRCPFPEYMHEELFERTVRSFMEWTFELDEPDSISAEELSEKFNEVIQSVGMSLASTSDEQLTIQYPYLPRVGDKVNLPISEGKTRTGEIVKRSLVEEDGNKELKVWVRFLDSGEEWETGFVLSE